MPPAAAPRRIRAVTEATPYDGSVLHIYRPAASSS
jgi:hypothetical protein